jgi:signal transduction histidine kinase
VLTHIDRRFLGFNLLIIVIAAALLLMVALTTFVFTDRTESQANESFQVEDAERQVMHLMTLLVEAESSQRGYLLTQSEPYLAPYHRAREQFWADFALLKDHLASLPEGVTLPDIAPLGALAQEKFTLMERTITLTQNGAVTEALTLVHTAQGKEVMENARTLVGAFQQVARSARQQSVVQTRDSVGTLSGLTNATLAGLVILIIGMVAFVLRHTKEIEVARRALSKANGALSAANLDLERRVRERTQGLQRANEEVQRYAYIVSHDLRAPLVNIMGFTGEIESATSVVKDYLDATAEPDAAPGPLPSREEARLAVEEDIPEALAFIRTSSSRMDSLINEILKLSRLGRRQLVPERLDVQTLVEQSIETLQHRLDEAGAMAVIEGSLPPIKADRLAVEQIFANLLDNAVKYLSPVRPGQITVRGWIEQGEAHFEVCDNGRGIAPADHERVFDLFRRAGSQDTQGEGIGLAHVRSLARRLGGEVTVSSDGQSGSTFHLTLAESVP